MRSEVMAPNTKGALSTSLFASGRRSDVRWNCHRSAQGAPG